MSTKCDNLLQDMTRIDRYALAITVSIHLYLQHEGHGIAHHVDFNVCDDCNFIKVDALSMHTAHRHLHIYLSSEQTIPAEKNWAFHIVA